MTSTPSGRFDRSIVDGPIAPAVWRLAWPTMLQNAFGGLQGIVDHVMVGNFVGFTGNAAIGVSWQIFLVVMVFVSSLFSGMAVLVARFAGADDPEKVNRTVAQAMIMAGVLSVAVLAPIGWFASPWLLELVNAEPAVRAEALPFLRIMFTASLGMMLFFMLGGALRAAGDAQTPLRLGVALTLINIGLNVLLIPGFGPIPRLGTMGAAIGTNLAGTMVSGYAVYRLWKGGWVISVRDTSWRPDWTIIRALFRFGLPTGVQGVAMNIAGVLLLRFIGSLDRSAEAQAAYAVGYTELFSLITWTSVGLMGAAAAYAGQNLGAGHPDRAVEGVRVATRIGLGVSVLVAVMFLTVPRLLLAGFGMSDPAVVDIGVQLLTFLSVSGLFISVALVHTGGLQGTGDTRGPLYISIVSQIVIPLGICSTLQALRGLQPTDIWSAILVGHATRCLLSVIRFRQGKWRNIRVEIEPART
ncbi:MAG TPA: MATE family efflux transporter [Gemmatimonadaceae bacterium]|nr:MATE family efflux transporter [Gemmatimonadaceae bacterium]